MDTSSTNKDSKEVKDLTGTQNIPLSDITVWVDPLDATKEYSGIECRVFIYFEASFSERLGKLFIYTFV